MPHNSNISTTTTTTKKHQEKIKKYEDLKLNNPLVGM
jgi:hypothetical protein